FEASLEAGTPPRAVARPVGLVVGRLVDDVQAQFGMQVRERFAHAHVHVVGFDDAGPRDEERGRSPEVGRHVSRGGWRAGSGSVAPPARRPRLPALDAAGGPRPRSRRTTGAAAWAAI